LSHSNAFFVPSFSEVFLLRTFCCSKTLS